MAQPRPSLATRPASAVRLCATTITPLRVRGGEASAAAHTAFAEVRQSTVRTRPASHPPAHA
eukprot:4642893-Prymnesium_polylepis.1